MKLLIDNLKLKLLLEKRREYVGNKLDGLDTFLAGLFFLLSLLCSEYHNIGMIDGLVIKTLAFVIGTSATIYGFVKIISSHTKKYNHEILYSDIENLNEITHPFSIVAVKDTFNQFPNRFLLYYDKTWECWFFFSFKTSDVSDEDNIKIRLSNLLHIESKFITTQYISARIQPKHSLRDNIDKVYLHRLYRADVTSFPELCKEDSFEIDGVKFRWMSIPDMEDDVRIMEVNKDVVSMVKDKIS
jgi:hypothetical protein